MIVMDYYGIPLFFSSWYQGKDILSFNFGKRKLNKINMVKRSLIFNLGEKEAY